MKILEKEMRESVKTAVTKHKNGKTEKLVVKTPVRTRITSLTSLYADAAELLPTAKRIDALRVEYVSRHD